VRSLIESIEAILTTDSVSASSTHARVLRQLHKRFPEMSLGLSRGHSLTKIRHHFLRRLAGRVVSVGMTLPVLFVAKRCGAKELMIQHHTCTRLLVIAAHAARLRVNVWTVDYPDDMRRARRIGVDGIISNRPDLVLDVLE
jgi:glycerophosphoryl diester phosphodiesterase